MEKGGKSPCITVIQGKSTTVLEMEHSVIDFITICESPWSSGEYLSVQLKKLPGVVRWTIII